MQYPFRMNICQFQWYPFNGTLDNTRNFQIPAIKYICSTFFSTSISFPLSMRVHFCGRFFLAYFIAALFFVFPFQIYAYIYGYMFGKRTHMMKELIDLWWSTVINVLCAIRRVHPFYFYYITFQIVIFGCWCFEV